MKNKEFIKIHNYIIDINMIEVITAIQQYPNPHLEEFIFTFQINGNKYTIRCNSLEQCKNYRNVLLKELDHNQMIKILL